MKRTLSAAPKATATKKREAPAELKTTKVGNIKNARSWVLYGRSGTGKTTLAGTFPQPHLLLDVKDEGTDSISDGGDIDVMHVNATSDMEEAYMYLLANPKRYKTVTIDTVSQLQQLVVSEVAARKNRNSDRAGDWGTMTKQDWGDVASYLKTWLMNFRDLARDHGIEVVFIAQDRVNREDDTDDQAIAPEVGPRLSPSVAAALNAMVSVIGHTLIRAKDKVVTDPKTGKKRTVQRVQYCLRVGPNPTFVTKLRKPKSTELPEFVVDPDYDTIVDLIQ